VNPAAPLLPFYPFGHGGGGGGGGGAIVGVDLIGDWRNGSDVVVMEGLFQGSPPLVSLSSSP